MKVFGTDDHGMPVPPAWLAGTAMGLRYQVGRAHDRMTPAFGLVLERLFGLLDNKALYCAVQLRVPDLLSKGSLTAQEIAERSDADADAVERLLRFLTLRGFFVRGKDGRYRNNSASDILRADHEGSWRGWVEFLGSAWLWEILDHLPDRVRGEGDATTGAHGVDFFSFVNESEPAAGTAFNDAMAAGSRMQSLIFAQTMDLDGYRSVCDVGGGTGSTLVSLLQRHPGMRGTVFDLPQLEAEATALFASTGLGHRAEFVGGDFFEAVPGGHDLYTLFAVVHDWRDEDCTRILRRLREAMDPGSRAMIVEQPIGEHKGNVFVTAADLLMLTLTEGGRERSRDEYIGLVEGAGLRMTGETVLPTLFHVFEFGI